VLTHGAGGNANAPLLLALAEGFAARGLTVFRYDLPYRQERPTGPPRPGGAAKDREGLRSAVASIDDALIERRPIWFEGAPHDCPVWERERLPERAALRGLADLRTPTLFVHGSRDPFGSPEDIEAARRLIPARTALVAVPGAGHDLFRVPSRAGADIAAEIVSKFLQFV